MPKVGQSVFDYKNRITDLESEVSTLKRRLDELRRAKVQAFYKQPAAERRTSKSDMIQNGGEQVNQVNQSNGVGVLEQRITRLQNELELAELKYERDTKELQETIKRLQEEMNSIKEAHQEALSKLSDEHRHEMAMAKRRHTEELALYSEKTEQEKTARAEAEAELVEYKSRMRGVTLQLPDVGALKGELTRLQDSYYALKLQHEQEVGKLEERIADLLADIAAHNEKSKRRFQLIPDRTYIVKKSTPTASSTSIGSVSERTSHVEPSTNKSPSVRPKSAVKKSEAEVSDQSIETTSAKQITSTSTIPKCQTYNNRVETIDRPKSTTTIRPKSSFTRKSNPPVPPDKKAQPRPKSCWSDQRRSSGTEKRTVAVSGTVGSRPRYSNVSSKIDTGRGEGHMLPRETLTRHRSGRLGSVGSGVPPWQSTSRSYVSRTNRF